MLMLCITGLPLIFHEEIDDLLHEPGRSRRRSPGTPPANLDRVRRQCAWRIVPARCRIS